MRKINPYEINTEYFKCINNNPKGIKAGDCVVRSISLASEETWDNVYVGLCELGLKLKDMPNNKRVFEKYLQIKGYEKLKMPKHEDNTRYNVKELARELPHGNYIVSVANHLTCIIDGVIHDTWNCVHKSVGNYWKVK